MYAIRSYYEMVLVSSNHYTKPDNSLGYGIPNFGVTLPSYITKDYKDNNQVFPNPFVITSYSIHYTKLYDFKSIKVYDIYKWIGMSWIIILIICRNV